MGGLRSVKQAAPAFDIPVIILAGGHCVHLQGELQPKACLKVRGISMLAHTIAQYRRHGFRKFFVCTGSGHQKVETLVREENNQIEFAPSGADGIKLLRTGEATGTGNRLFQAMQSLPRAPIVAVSYVDILCDVNLKEVLLAHENEGAAMTLTAVNLPTRFRAIGVALFSSRVRGFAAKPITEDTLVCGGYYFLSPDRLTAKIGDWSRQDSLEDDVLPLLASKGCLHYHKHDGYWQSIDSDRDIRIAEQHLAQNNSTKKGSDF